MLEGLWMFSILCLFYFFYRLNQFEKVLLTQMNKQKKINQKFQSALEKAGAQPAAGPEKEAAEKKAGNAH